MGATALQKYIGSFGGIGTLGIDPSSLYALNEFTKEYTPEKVYNNNGPFYRERNNVFIHFSSRSFRIMAWT